MRIPPKAKKCQEIIDKLVNYLEFYMYGTEEFKRILKEDIDYLENYLIEISEEHKIHNIRFASKLKYLWKEEMEEKDKIIKELEKKVEELDGSDN